MGFIGSTVKRAAASAVRAAATSVVPHRPPSEPLEARVLFSSALEAFGPSGSVVWKGQTVQAYENQWVVDATSTASFSKLATQKGFTAVKALGGSGYYQFTSTAGVAQMRVMAANHPAALAMLQPNMVVMPADTEPNDPGYAQKWGLSNTGQLESYDYNNTGIVTPYDAQTFPDGLPAGATTDFPSPPNPNENQIGTAGDDISATKAWDITTGSKNVVVAVLDTGIDLTHPDLVNNIWTNPLDTAANGYNGDGYPGDIHGYNFIDDNADPSDHFGHGTNVAGIIGAQGNNGLGVTGVNWNVSLIAVKVLSDTGPGSSAGIIAGVNYVINLKDHGINVVAMNESLGGTGFPLDVLESKSIEQAGKAGILDVVAAGNDSNNLDRTFSTPGRLSVALPSVITVAAVDNQFKIADFSDFGANTVDLGAPGVNIYSTLPTTPFYELTSDQASEDAEIPRYYQAPPLALNYGYESGTSQATPTVAGIIALEAAANPAATMMQLKQALLKGVTYDPNLAAANGRPALVATSGVANAYGAVMAVLNPFDGTNTTRGGSWVGYYGSQGSYVVGDSSTAATSVATITTAGGSPVVVANNSGNLAALQRASDPTSRVLAYEGSATTETIHLAFTDAAAHKTTLYLLDADHKRRTETVSLVDPVTGRTLDAETVGAFTKGEYLSWDLRGTLDLVITSVSGGAAYSGLFFDAPTASPITYQGTDTTTAAANWRNTYGSQGAFIAGDANDGMLPAYVTGLDVVGGTATVLKATTRDPRSLQKQADLTHSIQSYYSSTASMDLNVTVSDTATHMVTLYLADYGNKKRAERIAVIDTASGATLVTQDVNNFSKGQFVTFRVSGNVTFRITRTAGPDAVVSGVFFDAPFGANAHFAGTNTTLGGNWRAGIFGSTAAFVVGDDFPGLDTGASDSRLSITGASRAVLATPTADRRALYKTEPASSGTRVEAYAFTTSSMTLSYNPGDYVQHELTLYFADYENDHRTESVTLINGNNPDGPVLTHQVVTNFRQGKYLTFDVSGPVLVEINNGAYPNAVLSGVFVD